MESYTYIGFCSASWLRKIYLHKSLMIEKTLVEISELKLNHRFSHISANLKVKLDVCIRTVFANPVT